MGNSEGCTSESIKNKAVFTINKKKYQVDKAVPFNTSLNAYIRDYANLQGTKFMCLEGGCGACIVYASLNDPVTKTKKKCAVNSCLVSVFSCNGWDITTIEGIGSKSDGYNEIQKRLALFNGTQCGYCSPGMVMNMYSLMESKKDLTMMEVENSFGGNICRCTGYRSILDGFKSLCVDATPELLKQCEDIEELQKICSKDGKPCMKNCKTSLIAQNESDESTELSSLIYLQSEGSEWYTVSTIQEILVVFNKIGNASYMLVAGNTAQGVYHRTVEPQCYIDINGVKELKACTTSPNVTIGANMSLTEVMVFFDKLAKDKPDQYAYTKALVKHIDLIANVGVRNIGTIAGNLSIKHEHNEFPSDICLILESVGVTLVIVNKYGKETNVNILTYLSMDMKHKLIKNIIMPPLDKDHVFVSYKIMPRAQNSHAYVNAGFLFKFDENTEGKILTKPNIIFGGINPKFLHASKTEELLQGKNILQDGVLQSALSSIDKELQPDHVLPDASPAYRKGLACSLFYKFILNVFSDKVQKSLKSGGQVLVRPLSSGKQDFDTNRKEWPLNQPIPKIEAYAQCSGEALYINDIPIIPGELYAAFVTTTVGQGQIKNVNTNDALKLKGVVTFLNHKNIPGKNYFTPPLFGMADKEEILCSGKVLYAGQPLGIIIANSHKLALRAAQLVKVEYEDVKKPLITITDVLKSGEEERISVQGKIDPTDTESKAQTKHVIKGSYDIGFQYHYTMETQISLCIPIEDGMDVYSSTQWMDATQWGIAIALGVSENSINVNVRRLGGGYGAKISRATLVSTACAIAANAVKAPVRFFLSMEDNMHIIGKRYACRSEYEVGMDDEGVIKYMNTTLYENTGCSLNETRMPFTVYNFVNCYDRSTWSVTGKSVITDIATNVYCRGPGAIEGIAFIENIMEHIAKEVKKDPIQVRLNNLSKNDIPLQELINDIKNTSSYEERVMTCQDFNENNRWHKRGIAMVPMAFPFEFYGDMHAIVSIYAGDGTVSVSHGGIECGQGLNTKVLQVCAYTLGIPLDLIMIKPSNNLIAPNDVLTGASFTSDICSYAAMMCCKELLKRLEPVKQKLKNPSWQELIAEAFLEHIDLCATYMFTVNDNVKNYTIWGVTVAEVEIDILTGEHQILRVDITEDTGESMSPMIDIGQVEGGFMMGLGYFLMEELIFDPDTGMLLTDRTWNYKPPGAKDIPIDFRIKFRKNAPNPVGVLRSKATGEPPLCMSSVLAFAVRNALNSARANAGKTETWYEMNSPATTENIFLSGLTKYEQFSL